jgi:hypothetical protein
MYTGISGGVVGVKIKDKNDIEEKKKYDPTHFIQDPMRVIYDLEQKMKVDGSVVELEEQSIKKLKEVAIQKYNKEPGVTNPLTDEIVLQPDFFGILTKLWNLKRPREAKSSIICVMACIRTSHTTSSDSYRSATERTLNFAISVSASNPALRAAVAPIVFKASTPQATKPSIQSKLTTIGPTQYALKRIAQYVLDGTLSRTPQSKFNGRLVDDPSGDAKKTLELKRKLLDEYLDSDEYKTWEAIQLKGNTTLKPIEKDQIMLQLLKGMKNGGTRRKRKSGGNKKTRRI